MSHSHDSPNSHTHDHSDPTHVCGGHEHDRELTAEEIEAQKAERKAFDAVLRCFYQYEAHSVRLFLPCLTDRRGIMNVFVSFSLLYSFQLTTED